MQLPCAPLLPQLQSYVHLLSAAQLSATLCPFVPNWVADITATPSQHSQISPPLRSTSFISPGARPRVPDVTEMPNQHPHVLSPLL